MFHFHIIIHFDKQIQQQMLRRFLDQSPVHLVDLWQTPTESISILQIRELKTFLAQAPFASERKVAVIQGDLLTQEAQQALLKTLEEPPPHALVFILTKNEETLLPTILSRGTIVKERTTQETTQNTQENVQFWKPLLASKGGERLRLTTGLPTERTELKEWCKQQILFLRSNLIDQVISNTSELNLPSSYSLYILKRLQKSLYHLDQNLSVRLVLDHLFLDL